MQMEKIICKTSRECDDKAKNELNDCIKNIQIEQETKIKENICIEDNINNFILDINSPFFKRENNKSQQHNSNSDSNNLSENGYQTDSDSNDPLNINRIYDYKNNKNKNKPIKSEECIYENNNTETIDFNKLMMDKICSYKHEMLDFLDNARNEVEKLYDDLYTKTADIANRKAKRISQLYNESFPFHHSKSDKIKNTFNLDSNIKDDLDLKNSVSHTFKFKPNFRSYINNSSEKDKTMEITYEEDLLYLSEQEKEEESNTNNQKVNSDNNIINDGNTCYNDMFEEESKEKEIMKIKDFARKNLIKKIRSMFDLQENLKLSLIQNFELMKNFLSDFDLNSNNPLQQFVDLNAKEICNSWLLPKISFENLNMTCFINNKEIPVTFKNFIVNEESKNKFTSYLIERNKNTKNFEFERKILKNNFSFLNKLELISLQSKADLKKIFYEEQINKLNFDKMKKIKFEKSKLDNINYLFFFPNLAKLYFKSCRFMEMPSHFSENFNKLKQISFKNSNLNNDNVSFLMNEFQSLSNIEIINFSENNITNFSFIPNSQFTKLHSLLLRKNKISKINIGKEFITKFYPKLDFLDLYSNNICSLSNLSFENFEKGKNHQAIVLLSKNLILHYKANLDKIYAKYLISALSNTNAYIAYLDLSHLLYKFKKDPEHNFRNLTLNMNIQISLRKLDLSFNGLVDADLYYFFNENKGLVNLNKIKLRNNNFTENILEIFLKINSQNLFEYLKTINLSGNNLDISSLDILRRVIDDNKNLSKIIISKNPIIDHIEMFLNNKASPLDRYCMKSFFDHIEEINKKQKRKLKIKYY